MNKLSLTFILFMTACNNSSKSPELKVESEYQKEYLNKIDSICTDIELDAVKGICPNKLAIALLDKVDAEGNLGQKKRAEICKMRLNAYNCIK